MHRVDRAIGGCGSRGRPQSRISDAEADLLAFHVGGVKSEGGEVCIAVGFGPVANQKCAEEDDRHRCIDRPALPLILDHAAEGMSERRRNQQDVQHFKKVADGGRVFIGDG